MSIPGKLLLHLWHAPAGRVRDSIRFGGPIAQWHTERARREMVEAAGRLPALPDFPGSLPVTLHVMTGRQFWYQTAFCLHSFSWAAQATVAAELYDDGTLDEPCARLLSRLGPRVRFHSAGEAEARLEKFLPASRFPALRERWLNYPNIRKMTDIHLGGTGWKLVIDSDLLFFRKPDAVLRWCQRPDLPLHAVDCRESYGYSRPLMESLAGAPIPPLVNVGLSGMKSDALDWPEIESWCATMIARERTNYYLEQALIAMLMARDTRRVVLSANDYITMPEKSEALAPKAVMHHYVAESKRWYYCYAWRRFPAEISQ